MDEMTKKERVRRALAGLPVDHVPTALWGHDFLREWSPEDLAAATLEAYRTYDWDFIKFNPRATYFAEAWGNRYERPTEQRQPSLVSRVISAPDELEAVRPVDPRGGVFGEHLTALRLLLGEVRAEVDVVHTIFSPLSVVAQLCRRDADFREFAARNPHGAHAALATVAETLGAYALAAIREGAAGIFLAPLAWASRDTCPEEFYAEFGRPYDLQVLAAVREAPFNILHVCRNHNMLDLLLDYPVAAFNWAERGDGNASLGEVRARTPKAVMGGIDHNRLHEVSPDAVASEARAALASGTKRLFLTGGCAIRPETPAANRAAVAVAASL